ncbi:hypothetical protein Tco_0566080 [Tanacetum coccineum]
MVIGGKYEMDQFCMVMGVGVSFCSKEKKNERILNSCEMKGYACTPSVEEFVYQVDNKNVKRSNEMYCPRLTKVIVNFFLTKDQSIPRRNKWQEGRARSDKAPKAPKGKRLKATSKVTKPSKKKLPDQGLETLSEVSLTEEEQMRIVTKRSLTQFQVHAQQISSDEDDDAENKNDDDDDDVDNQDDDGQEYDVQDDENQDDDNEQIDSDNDGDDFVHLKFSNHDEEDKEEDSFDPRVQTPSCESTDDGDSDEEIQSPDTGIDSIFNLNTESTSLVDVPVTTIAEPPLLSATILPPPPTPLITHLQLKNHSSHTSNYSNLLPTRSSQLCIVDAYLANKMHKAVKTAVQLQSDRLRDEAQAENKDFINKLDNNIKKIIKDQDKEHDKLILDTFGDTVSFKRRRDDEDKDKEPFEEPMHTAEDLEDSTHQEFVTGDTKDKPDEETSQHPDWHPPSKLDWNNPEGQQYPHDLLTKTKAADYGHIKWIEDLVPNRMWSQVPINLYEGKLIQHTPIPETALNDSLKGIWMKYLPQTIWRQSDRDKAGAMSRQFDNSLRPGGLCGAWRNLLVGDRTRETFTLQGTH